MTVRAELADGRVLEFPDGTDPSVIQSTVKRMIAAEPRPQPKEGITAALTGGFKRFLSTGETALESLVDPELAAQRGVERAQKISEQYAPGASLEKVKQAYAERGLFPAVGEAISQIPSALVEQAPQIAATLGSAKLGAMAGSPLGPVGALVGGIGGAVTPSLMQLYGANLERQAEEKVPEISRSAALAAAAPGAALEVASTFIPLGRNLVGKLLGPNAEKALARGSNEAIERKAQEALTTSLLKGTAVGSAVEIPTEVTQQMLERLQAGLPLTTEDAFKEYGEAAYGAGLVGGPFGGAARVLGRPAARAEFEKIQQEEADRLAVSEEELAQRFPDVLPGGFKINREEVGREMAPEGFSIMVEGRDEPLSVVDTQEEADEKLASLTQIRERERENLLKDEEKINTDIQKGKDRLEQLEATEQTDTDDYKALKAELPTMMDESAQKIKDLYDKSAALAKPLTVMPFGEVERVNEQFNVIGPDNKPVGSFKTLGEAEAVVEQAVGKDTFKQTQQNREVAKDLYKNFVPQMRKFGLGDVGLNIVDRIENGAGGAYLDKLIRVSLEEEKPVQTMRHESLHAMKDLGFFTPQQWKALEERANKEWIKTYLEGQKTEIDGQEMTRLEGYKKLGYTQEAIVEEAIADAFGAYDKGAKPPPGMIAALFRKIKNFFSSVGQAFRGAGFQSADDIFQNIERGRMKPTEVISPEAKATEKLSLKQTTTPEFKGWFGKSKVVDDVGKPKIMYHGLAKDTTDFTRKTARGAPIFLTDDPKFAVRFAVDSYESVARNPQKYLSKEQIDDGVKRAIAAIKKDYGKDSLGKEMIESLKIGNLKDATPEAREYIQKEFINLLPTGPHIMPLYVRAERSFDYQNYRHVDRLKEEVDLDPDLWRSVSEGDWDVIESKEVQEAIQNAGFDSFYVKEHGRKNLAVYSANQVKSATGNVGTFSRESGDVRLSLPIMRGEETPLFDVKPTVDAIGKYFDKKIKDQYGDKLDYSDKTSFDRAIKTASEEIAYQLKQQNSGLDWYEQDIKKAFKQTQQFIPQLSKAENRLLFSIMAGIMSPQTTARDNWFIAAKAFEHYVDNKVIPGTNPETGGLWQGGTTAANKKIQLDFLNKMVGDMGQKKAIEWLFQDHTVKEINEFRRKYGNIKTGIDGKLTDMRPGLYAFGPKVGPFVANLNGIHDVTVDKWMTRTFNRYFGTMTGPDGKIVDAPTEPQRRAIKALINEVATNAGIKPYQAQSLLWFYEQRLFTKMGVLSPSYGFSDGSKRFAEARGRGGEEGVSDAAQPTAERVKGERRETTRPEQPVKRPSQRGKLSIQRSGDGGGREEAGRFAPLEDAPAVEGFYGPDPSIVKVAEQYAKDKGIKLKRQARYVDVDPDRARRIADEYEKMEHAPQDPKVKKAYQDLVNQTIDQYRALEKAGYKFWFIDLKRPDNLSYLSSPWNAMRDVRANKTMGVFPTNEGFGSDANFSADANPLLADTGIKWPVGSPTGPLAPVFANDVFRAVHDVFGHGIEGAGFRARGEENAWQAHAKLFTGPAVGAITSETRGQNSWLNYGPYGDKNKTAKVEDTVFADQKTGLMPEWTWTEGRVEDMPEVEKGIVLGTKQLGAISVKGAHYGNAQVEELNASKYGTGLRGAERRRLDQTFDDRIKKRVYFYIQKEDGTTPPPESGVGQYVYTQKFDNILGPGPEMSRLFREVRGDSNDFESSVIDAGYDGYAVPSMGMMVILNHNVPVNYVGPRAEVGTAKLSLKGIAFPKVKDAQEAADRTFVPDTAEFKQYIAGSQWVDEDGKAKKFFHATTSNFFEFKDGAIYLSENAADAEKFGRADEDRLRSRVYRALNKDEKLPLFQRAVDKAVEEGKISAEKGVAFMRDAKRSIPDFDKYSVIKDEMDAELIALAPKRMQIMPLYARAMTPFDFRNPDHVSQVMRYIESNFEYIRNPSERVKQEALERGFPTEYPDNWLKGLRGLLVQGYEKTIEQPPVQNAFRRLGFDGYITRKNRTSPLNYVVYQPQQIKSVTGNDGQFSLETKDIRYSLKNVRYSPDRFQKLWDESMYTQSDAENKTKGYLAFVDPMAFVKATARPETFEQLLQEREPLDIERLKAYDAVPFLSVSEKDGEWKITGHEGRHRMLALHDAGYREIPVYIHLRADDAKSIPVKTLKAQFTDAVSSILMAAEVEPLSYANKQKAMEKFTRMESKVKYSLPTLSQATNDRIKDVTPGRVELGWKDRVIGTFKQDYTGLRQKFLNRYETLGVNDRLLRDKIKKAGGPDLLADQSAEFAALQSDLSAGVAASAMGIGDRQGGVPVYRNGLTTIDTSVKGLVESLAPLAKYGDQKIYQRYQFWAGWKRGRRLLREGREDVYTAADAKVAQEIENAHPEFIQVQKDLIAFNNGIVKYAVQTGVLSRERAQVYTQYADYIPFYRQLDLDKTIGPNPFGGISGVKGPKELKGGDSPLGDFLENMVRNTQSMINAGMKNAAAQRATNVAMQINNSITRLPAQTTGVGFDVYTQLENGQVVYYRSADPLFIEALKSLNMPDLPFMGLLSAPANVLRNLVTKDPGFMMANLLRDSLSSYVTSGQKVTPIVGTMVNFGKALTGKDKTLQALFNAGAIGGYEFSQNIEQSGKSLSADLNKKAGKDPMLLRPFKSLWEGLEKGTTASDAATRMAVYERVMKETGNEAEAISRALEVMNFNRKGNSVLIRIATAALPFFNARLQGLDLFYRASAGQMNSQDAQEIKRRFWIRGMTMASLSVMYYLSVADDEEYEKQEEETKDNNWIFTSLGIRIPIPFEVGTLFKTMPERITAYFMGNDTGKDLAQSTLRALANTFAFNPIPQTFKPIIEAATNYNFFTMRPIVGQGMQEVEPKFQVGPGTSKTAEYIGGLLNLSPLKVDQLIKGYTGTIGGYVTDVVDSMANEFSDVPKASKRFEQLPVVKRFALDPEARGSVTQFYELQRSVDTVVRTMSLLEKTARPEEYADYLQKNIGVLAVKDYVRDIEKSMKELRDMRRFINSTKMDADEKRDIMTDIGRAEINLTANIKEVKKVVSALK